MTTCAGDVSFCLQLQLLADNVTFREASRAYRFVIRWNTGPSALMSCSYIHGSSIYDLAAAPRGEPYQTFMVFRSPDTISP
ncbi:hypothetical protein LB504_008275 [Fusarium proliferatum]|nr:hypothetical protein LB504_008275 [Fusarium proliferatum]